jgi:transcriptional regulator with XRE-family HTH domain
LSENSVQNDASIVRGIRLKRVREIANLTSDELAKKAGVSRQSLSYWENASQNGLSSKGAQAIVQALEEYGFRCDFNWLWSGVGDEPYRSSEGIRDHTVTAALPGSFYPSDLRAVEIKAFAQNYSDAVVMEVKHNAMKPLYQSGDWIGGCWRALSPKLLGQICIVEIAGYLEVRVCKTRDEKGYSLRFMTYSEETMEPFELENQNPLQVAPVIRVWRK